MRSGSSTVQTLTSSPRRGRRRRARRRRSRRTGGAPGDPRRPGSRRLRPLSGTSMVSHAVATERIDLADASDAADVERRHEDAVVEATASRRGSATSAATVRVGVEVGIASRVLDLDVHRHRLRTRRSPRRGRGRRSGRSLRRPASQTARPSGRCASWWTARLPVGRAAHVELDPVRAHLERAPERRHGVLGERLRRAPVSDHGRHRVHRHARTVPASRSRVEPLKRGLPVRDLWCSLGTPRSRCSSHWVSEHVNAFTAASVRGSYLGAAGVERRFGWRMRVGRHWDCARP